MSLLVTVDGAVATITLNRPQMRNALDLDTIDTFLATLDTLAANPEIRLVELTGAGDKVFCAGADLGAVALNPELRRDAMRRYATLIGRLASFERPVLARLQGHCLAGGMGLLLACDLAVAADHIQLSLPEAAVGMWPMMVGALLVRDLPRKLALELALTGRKLSAAEGVGLGLLNRAVPLAELDSSIAELRSVLLRQSPTAFRLGRRAWRDAAALPMQEGLELLAERLGDLADTEDAVEGMMAFLQKRAPTWADR